MQRPKASRPTSAATEREPRGNDLRQIDSVATPKSNARQLLRYANVKSLAAELDRPASTLVALAPNNDPFSITEARRNGAQWFARIWKRLAIGSGAHLHRLHYAIISQSKPVKMSDGTPYENTQSCWQALIRTSNDARYLDPCQPKTS